MNNLRRKTISALMALLEDIKSDLENVKDEEEEYDGRQE